MGFFKLPAGRVFDSRYRSNECARYFKAHLTKYKLYFTLTFSILLASLQCH